MPSLSIIISEIPRGASLPLVLVELDSFVAKKRLKSFEIIVLDDKEETEKQIRTIKDFLPETRLLKKEDCLGEEGFFKAERERLIWIDVKKGNITKQAEMLFDCKEKETQCALVSSKKDNFLFKALEKINKTLAGILKIKNKNGFPAGLCGLYIQGSALNTVQNTSIHDVVFDFFEKDIAVELLEIKEIPRRTEDYFKLWTKLIGGKINNRKKRKTS